jgi:ABC-type multidrug transport system fused ATPase/permease subunit
VEQLSLGLLAARIVKERRVRRRLGAQGKILVAYLRPQRARVALLALLLFGSIGLQLFNPQILKQFIDSAIHPLRGYPGASDRTPAVAAGLFPAIALLQLILPRAAVSPT